MRSPGADSQGSDLLSESEAYHLLSDADSCATFEGAKALLDRLDPREFTDPDLVTCIVFSKKLVEFCLIGRGAARCFRSRAILLGHDA